jgi:hypothetical protein
LGVRRPIDILWISNSALEQRIKPPVIVAEVEMDFPSHSSSFDYSARFVSASDLAGTKPMVVIAGTAGTNPIFDSH